jgi:6-phosphogluconolactonase
MALARDNIHDTATRGDHGGPEESEMSNETVVSITGVAAVYLQTNQAKSNKLLAFERAADGTLKQSIECQTAGAGDGAANLASQGSVVLTGDAGHLLVTNAGSGDVSLFAVGQNGPTLVHTRPTGAAPKSVAEHGGLVYVLNTGDPSVSGFRLRRAGLEPLPDSTRALAAGADPAQVGFSPDGSTLVVTQRGTNSVVAYPVDDAGLLGDPQSQPSSGATPYGFAVTRNGVLVVTEAFGAQVGKAAASSYRFGGGGLAPVSRSVGNGRTAICWAVVTRDGRHVFATNFADGAVSRYVVAADGSLELADAAAGLAVDGARGLRDADLSRDGRFLYAIDTGARCVFGWAVGDEGSLAPIGSWNGLPDTAAGLAAG